jgi:hypothetical protein
MGLSRDELLRPSLTGVSVARAPYSVQTVFMTSFFGGPFAAIAIIGVNSVRLQRLPKDLPVLGAALVAVVGFMAALYLTGWGVDLRNDLTAFAGPRAASYLFRVIGFVIFGIGYTLHRAEQRSADFMGLDRPNGWIGGLACIAGGTAVSFLAGFLIALVQEL